MGRLDGKVAIITGGVGGMGTSHVRRFISEGAKVVFTDILVEEGKALANELGENALFIKHDVADASDWDRVVAETENKFGAINILVNNAAITLNKSIEETTEQEYRKVIDIDQVSVFLGMKAVLPSMKKTNNGSIVNISSSGGLLGTYNLIAYVAAKFAVRGMTKAAAIEFAEHGIRVNSVHPGMIETPFTRREEAKEQVAAMLGEFPLKRIGKPEEVSNLVLYLASDESSFSTGSEFVIDGGQTAQL